VNLVNALDVPLAATLNEAPGTLPQAAGATVMPMRAEAALVLVRVMRCMLR